MDFSKRTLNPFENKTCFLSLKSLSTEELKELIDRAVELSAMRAVKEQSATLKGRYVLLVTKNEYPNVKINFQIAVKELGGTPIVASVSGEAIEEFIDDEEYLKALTACGLFAVVISTKKSGDAGAFESSIGVPVINANATNSPIEGLSAVMAAKTRFQRINGLNVTFAGHFDYENNSVLCAFSKLGANITLLTSIECAPKSEELEYLSQFSRVVAVSDKREAFKNADLLYLGGAQEGLYIDESDLDLLPAYASVSGPVPVSPSLISKPALKNKNCLFSLQAENGVHASKAVLSAFAEKA